MRAPSRSSSNTWLGVDGPCPASDDELIQSQGPALAIPEVRPGRQTVVGRRPGRQHARVYVCASVLASTAAQVVSPFTPERACMMALHGICMAHTGLRMALPHRLFACQARWHNGVRHSEAHGTAARTRVRALRLCQARLAPRAAGRRTCGAACHQTRPVLFPAGAASLHSGLAFADAHTRTQTHTHYVPASLSPLQPPPHGHRGTRVRACVPRMW